MVFSEAKKNEGKHDFWEALLGFEVVTMRRLRDSRLHFIVFAQHFSFTRANVSE